MADEPQPGEVRPPPTYRVALEALARLPDVEADELLRVSSVPEYLSTTELVSRMESAAPTLDESARDLLSAVFSLKGRPLPWQGEELAQHVSISKTFKLAEEERQALMQRLAALLEAEAIERAAKATNVISEHERVFTDARIVTDVRPFFEDEPDSPPVGAGIVEMLKIDYLAPDGSDASFYVALDHRDLGKLKEVVDRALAKTVTLRRWMENTGVTYWEYEETRLADPE